MTDHEVDTWDDHQAMEASFWGSCGNTYGEETKQLTYLYQMGFNTYHDGMSPYAFQGEGLRILDIGGGPVSSLLKFRNCIRRVVVDPCRYPDWVYARYRAEGIEVLTVPGEDVSFNRVFNVALIYNVLQHVQDPEKIISNAKRSAAVLHMFEWVDIAPHPGHPHCLTQENLEKWTGQKGRTEVFTGQNECYGKAWIL